MPPTDTTTDDARFGYVTPENLALFTDLYELSMMQGYVHQEHNPRVTFDLFVRDLPPDRGYLLAAGLEQAVAYIESLTFGEAALSYLASEGFSGDFLSYLESFAFTGELRAIPEGTPVFPNEPLVEVTAPVPEAQLFETMFINQIGYQGLIATKAARMREVVRDQQVLDGMGQTLVDFGSRRAHGTDAGVKAARAAYIGGFDGTSNVVAGQLLDVPIYGTMAHSWVQSFPTERAAFEAFVAEYGDRSVLLIDTYDTIEGARTAASVAAEADTDIRGVRLDSGEMAALSREVRSILGPDVEIFVSSGMDEYAIREFLEDGGVADGFGPGTALVTSTDAPKVEGVYKLVAVERDGRLQPSMKLSPGKVTYPGRKSVRRVSTDGEYDYDVLDLADAGDEPGEELLVTVFEDGQRVRDLPDLATIQQRAQTALQRLPEGCRALSDPEDYEVRVGDALDAATTDTREELEAQMLGE